MGNRLDPDGFGHLLFRSSHSELYPDVLFLEIALPIKSSCCFDSVEHLQNQDGKRYHSERKPHAVFRDLPGLVGVQAGGRRGRGTCAATVDELPQPVADLQNQAHSATRRRPPQKRQQNAITFKRVKQTTKSDVVSGV